MSIKSTSFFGFDPNRVPSPCFVVDECAVERNLKILNRVQVESGAKVLLALKAFSMFSLAPLIMKYLGGTCSSGLHEALLGHQEFSGNRTGQDKREVHVFSPGFSEADFPQILDVADHVVFNSFNQWQRFRWQIEERKYSNSPNQDSTCQDGISHKGALSVGLRVNPMLSQGAVGIYDPCAPGSRLGIPVDVFHQQATKEGLEGISGLHFHTLCEQGFSPLERTLDVVEEQFVDWLPSLTWLNFGGGHHITHPDYDVDALIKRIKAIQDRYRLQVYLEPGEAIAIHTGVLVSEVLDLGWNQMDFAILDTSATCHMPDTLEMPYRADIFDGQEPAGLEGRKPHSYRLGGQTCLAGDVMGDYSFNQPLRIGQRLIFDDMSHYTMVKTSTFNGIGLPAIAVWNSETDQLNLVKEFGYDDFRNRLS